MADAREVMNIRQASHYLGISPDTLYKYVAEDFIPAFKLGNRWKFKKSILDSWMEDKSLSSAPRRPRKLRKNSQHYGRDGLIRRNPVSSIASRKLSNNLRRPSSI